MKIRVAEPSDVEQMVLLSKEFRESLSTYSPIFWRTAEDAIEKQDAWFRVLLVSPNAIVLVAEADSKLTGFVIANML